VNSFESIFTITPSDVIHVSDPFNTEFIRANSQTSLVRSAKRGIARHKQTGLEIKPGKTDQPYGGIKGRYVLQAVLNGLTVSSDQDYPDVAIYLYNSAKLITLNRSYLLTLLPQVRKIAISTGRILSLDKQYRLLKKAGTLKRKASKNQAYLFYQDQFSQEYQLAHTDIPAIRQNIIDERRYNFDPCLSQFNQALKQLIS